MKIIYVGSFNPITLGHIKISDYLLKKFDGSSITFVPTSDKYLKSTLETSFIDRVNMIKLAILNKSRYEINEVEEEFSKVNLRNPKTIETLNILKVSYPNEELVLLIGSDNYLNLSSWYHIKELLNNFKVIIYPRNKEFKKEESNLYNEFKDRFIFIDNEEIINISSTLARTNIKNNLSNLNILDEKVIKYIKENNLYID